MKFVVSRSKLKIDALFPNSVRNAAMLSSSEIAIDSGSMDFKALSWLA